MTKEEAVALLVKWCDLQVGYKEGPNNWNIYAENFDAAFGWHVQNQPWCDIFVKRGFVECFGPDAAAAMIYETYGSFSAGCAVSANYFKKAGAWSDLPEVGDQVFFNVNGAINHTGIVVAVSGSWITTVEGNSGDGVKRNSYRINDTARIAGYGIQKWSVVSDGVTPEPSPQPEPEKKTYTLELPLVVYGDSGETVQSMQSLLIGKGFKCGWWGADGDFGDRTLTALRKYQSAYGLEVDGKCGGQTWASLLGVTI